MKVQGSHKKNGRLKLLQHLTKYWWLQSWSWSSLVWLIFRNWNATSLKKYRETSSMFFGLNLNNQAADTKTDCWFEPVRGVGWGLYFTTLCHMIQVWFGLVWLLIKGRGCWWFELWKGVGRGLYWTTLWPTSSTQEGSPVWLYSVHPLNHAHVLFEHSPVAECVSTLNI